MVLATHGRVGVRSSQGDEDVTQADAMQNAITYDTKPKSDLLETANRLGPDFRLRFIWRLSSQPISPPDQPQACNIFPLVHAIAQIYCSLGDADIGHHGRPRWRIVPSKVEEKLKGGQNDGC